MVEYADYKFYQEQFHGSTIPEAAFSSVILRASIYIKYITFGRIEDTEIPEAVRLAACAVSEVFHADDEMKAGTGGLEIKSENNDGYSVNYVTDGPDGKPITAEKKAYKSAYPYLVHTGLMYRGC